GGGRPGAAGRRCCGVGDRDRRPRRGNGGEARRPRLSTRRWSRRHTQRRFRPAGRPGHDPPPRDGHGSSSGPATLAPESCRYRETRSVGMLELTDPGAGAERLADDLQRRLEELGVYERERRTWLPHLTVVRFRERPRLRPPLPELGEVVPSDAAVFLSRLRPSGAEYFVVESFALGG